MNPSTNEQVCVHWASGPKSLPNIASTKEDRSLPKQAFDLPTEFLTPASQGHSAVIEPALTAADFSRRGRAVPFSKRFSFRLASHGNVAVVGPASTAATSHRIAGRFGEMAKATDGPNRSRWRWA